MKLDHARAALFLCCAQISIPQVALADAPSPDAAPGSVIVVTAKKKVSANKFRSVRDPIAIDPSTAFKDTEIVAINLPGVMKIEGADVAALDFSRARRVDMSNGGSITVYVSASEPNRIQLPFVNPRVISMDHIKLNKQANSNNVYVSFEGSIVPAQVFFEPEEGGVVMGMQLVPKAIPSQTIIVDDQAGPVSAELRKANKSNDYITATQSLMEVVSKGSTPSGYSVIELNAPPIVMNGLLVSALKKFSNRDGDLYVYEVVNPNKETAHILESEFDGDLVQAVSIFPRPLLRESQSTRVFVLANKEKPVQTATPTR